MKARTPIAILVIAALTLLFVSACKPVVDYLEQVNKVHGTVTVTGSDPPTPIGSVEVFIGDYQYSELTNYYGDYEMELSDGTWTINFVKEGYEPFSAEVTVGPEASRVRRDAALTYIAPPLDLTGYWYLFTRDTADDPWGNISPFYILQDGSDLHSSMGNGWVDGTAVHLEFVFPDEGTFVLDGDYADGVVEGIITYPWGETGFWRVVIMEPDAIGTLTLEGAVSGYDVTTTDAPAIGQLSELEIANIEQVDFPPTTVPGGLALRLYQEEWEVRSYDVGDYFSNENDDPFLVEAWIEGQDAGSGTVVVTEATPGSLAGTYDLYFDEGHIWGTFSTSEAGPASVSVDGNWGTTDISAPLTSTWGSLAISRWQEVEIVYLDDQLEIYLDFGNAHGLTAGNYGLAENHDEATGQLEMEISYWEIGTENEDKVKSASGQIEIETLSPTQISAWFEATFDDGGWMTGSFTTPLVSYIP